MRRTILTEDGLITLAPTVYRKSIFQDLLCFFNIHDPERIPKGYSYDGDFICLNCGHIIKRSNHKSVITREEKAFQKISQQYKGRLPRKKKDLTNL